ncbi:hypothetical protein EJV47_10920 [Hymenobacter gummosus]|uniref:Uncharacterized protein n=1 Tax=Hymenobacter gummosus TaxID=1776032 RepID=A0A3S0H728_9BACT|nr:hypothetical protein [Hymenobacter gummosus]RTQ50139.1 hypothetical protein EJV47_10920 [Hymenobacter gummosus]
MEYQQTKQRLFELLQTGHRVSVRWDCGGDESFVYISIDGEEQPNTFEPGNLAHDVEWLLTEALELPSAGEFSMSGGGQFFLEGRGVGLDYQSDAEVYEDELDDEFYNDFTDEQLTAMGLTRPGPQDESAVVVPPAESEHAEPAALRDEQMSNEYSGRRILFMLPD